MRVVLAAVRVFFSASKVAILAVRVVLLACTFFVGLLKGVELACKLLELSN